MLKKRERLSRREFELVWNRGARTQGKFFSLVARPAQEGTGKCAVVVSKKIARRATARNKFRRTTYSLLAREKELWCHKHLIILLKPSATTADSLALSTELHQMLQSL